MYLVGTNVLGFTANGNEIVQMDGSDTVHPLTTVYGRLTANLTSVSGGTF